MAREVHPDLESAAYGLLVRLDEGGRQRATELAAYIGVGKATMCRQLRALEDLGLVAREPDPADGRAWLVHLTEEGRARFRRVRDARRARYVSKLADWDRGGGRRTGAAAAPAEAGRSGEVGGAARAGGLRPRRVTAPRRPPSRRRASCRAAGTPAPCPRPPAPAPGRSAPCAPSLRSSREAVRPVALAEHLHPAGRPVRQRGQRPDLRARGAPVTARAATDGSAAAVKKPPSLFRTVRRRSRSVASGARAAAGSSRSSSTARHRPSGDSSSSAESESTRYSTVRGRPARQDHGGLRRARVRKVTGVAVGLGGAPRWPRRGPPAAAYPGAKRTVRSVRRPAAR